MPCWGACRPAEGWGIGVERGARTPAAGPGESAAKDRPADRESMKVSQVRFRRRVRRWKVASHTDANSHADYRTATGPPPLQTSTTAARIDDVTVPILGTRRRRIHVRVRHPLRHSGA